MVPASRIGEIGPSNDVGRAAGLRDALASAKSMANAVGDRVFVFAQGLPWKFPVAIVDPGAGGAC